MSAAKPKLLFLFLLLLFTIPSFLSLVILPFFTFHDEVQIVNLHQYIASLDFGSFPPRWAPNMHFNYGSPFPQFNYQLPYYVGYLLGLTGLSLTVIFKVLLAISLVIGALGMYFLGLQFTTPIWAFLASAIYLYAPYRAVVTYVRGTLGEAFALALFPWVFYSLYRLKKNPRFPAIIFAALIVAGLVLSHQLATILSFPFLLIIILGDSIISRDFKTLTRQLTALFIAALVSAYYWLPVLQEQKFIQPSSPFNFYDHFPFISQLISSPWGYGASTWGPYDGMSYQLGFANMAVIIIAIIFFLRRQLANRFIFVSLSISFFLSLFLMNIRSSFFWDVFPFTQLVQFPWRLLMLTTFFAPLLLVVLSPQLPKKLTLPVFFVLLVLAVYPSISYFQPGEVFSRGDDYFLRRFLPDAKLLPGEQVSAEYLNHTEDYVPLPVGVTRPTRLPDAKLTAIRSFSFKSIDDNPLDYRAEIGQVQEQPLIFHTFYFPGWRAAVDEATVPITVNEHGAITFVVPEGIHNVQVVYEETPLRKTTNLISLITLIMLLEAYLIAQLAHTARIKA